MRATKLILATAAVAVASLIGTARADEGPRNAAKDWDKSIASISKEARRTHTERDALHEVAVQTGVPAPKTQEMLNQWSDAGVGGVMIACTIADYTKRDPNVYMERRFHDHASWAKIIGEAGIPADRVDRNLTKLDAYVHSGAPGVREERRR